jgi:iron-sulfur cluster repair protein YtfE (RIC family)
MNEPEDGALVLGKRAALPDEVAYLRATYPRNDWRGHTNFGQLAAFWLHVHSALRHEGNEVTDIVEALRKRQIDGQHFQRAFVPRLNNFLQHLDHHHRIEDQAYFPKFRQLDERLIVGFNLLETDHEIIHERLIGTLSSARGLLNGLSSSGDGERGALNAFATEFEILLDLLRQHLADEEDLVIPAMLKHGERPLL